MCKKQANIDFKKFKNICKLHKFISSAGILLIPIWLRNVLLEFSIVKYLSCCMYVLGVVFLSWPAWHCDLGKYVNGGREATVESHKEGRCYRNIMQIRPQKMKMLLEILMVKQIIIRAWEKMRSGFQWVCILWLIHFLTEKKDSRCSLKALGDLD